MITKISRRLMLHATRTVQLGHGLHVKCPHSHGHGERCTDVDCRRHFIRFVSCGLQGYTGPVTAEEVTGIVNYLLDFVMPVSNFHNYFSRRRLVAGMHVPEKAVPPVVRA